MATVKEAMDAWGADFLRKSSRKPSIPEGASITFAENLPSAFFCDTCGPDPITVEISYKGFTKNYYGSLGEIIQDILNHETANES